MELPRRGSGVMLYIDLYKRAIKDRMRVAAAVVDSDIIWRK